MNRRYEDPGDILLPSEDSPAYAKGNTGYQCSSEVASQLAKELQNEQLIKFNACSRRAQTTLKRNIKLGRMDASLMRSTCKREHESRTENSVLRQHNERTAYDIINMQYKLTPEGKRLELHDQLVNYRSRLRSLNIAKKSHVGFNPITGVQTLTLVPPVSPSTEN